MEVKERIIDLRQYFIYLWENKWIIILVCILFTGALTGYSYYKQNKIINSPEQQETKTLNDIISQNHDAFYRLNDATAFTDADQPAGTYNCSARLFVDFNYSSIEGNTNLDFTQMTNKIQQDTMILLVSDNALQKVIDDLGLRHYDDMSDITTEKLKWMINRNFLGANVLQIVVTDIDKERAEKIASAVVDEFVTNSAEFATIDSVKDIDGVGEAIAGQAKGVQTSINKKSLLKYAIVGCAGGAFFICALYLILFIFIDAVRNSLDVAFADMSDFGNVSSKEKKKQEDIKRIAYNISLLKNVNKVIIVPTDHKSENKDIVEGIASELKSIKSDVDLELVKNIKDSADATRAAVESDAILIFARYGKTKMKDLLFAKRELEKTETKIVGAVIIN